MSIAMSTFAFYVVEFPSGGTGTAVLHTANELTKRGHRVFIYTARHLDDGYPLGYQPHFEVVTVPTINADTDENIRFLRNHITNNCVEALIVVAMHFLRLKELRENNSCKIVYALHGCPFYEEKLFNITKQMEANCNGRFGRWLSYWLIHHWRYKWFHSNMRKVLPIYEKTIAAVDKYVVLCEDYVSLISQNLHLSPQDASKLCVIKNGIMPAIDCVVKKEKIILFVGRLTLEDKRPMRLVDIWSKIYKKLPNWRFIVVGDGPEKQRLEDAVYKRGIERMIFPGFTNDTASYYRKASIVCLTSQYEGWPLCLAEGQAYGVVPIAFGCTAGIKDIVSYPMEDGVLARPFSCIDYAERLLQLASDEQQLSRMRNKCIEKSKSYTMLRNSQGYCRLLESLVKEQII